MDTELTPIEQRRKALNETIAKAGGIVAFAKAMGVSHQAVTSWRAKGHVSLERAVQMLQLFGTPRDAVLDPQVVEALNTSNAAELL